MEKRHVVFVGRYHPFVCVPSRVLKMIIAVDCRASHYFGGEVKNET
jgi:hypothetical protein